MGWGWVRVEPRTLDGWPPRRDATTIALRRQWPRHGCGCSRSDRCDRSRSPTRGPCQACSGAIAISRRDAQIEPSRAPWLQKLANRHICDEVRQNASISRRYIGEQAHMQFRAIRALMTRFFAQLMPDAYGTNGLIHICLSTRDTHARHPQTLTWRKG